MKQLVSALLAIVIALTIASPVSFSKEEKKSGSSKPKATQEGKKQAPKSDKEKGGIQYSPPQPKKEQAKKTHLKYCADVVYIKGDLRAKRASEERWFIAREGMPDYLFDHLKTDSSSVATVEFLNGSQVGINKGTELLIESESSAKDVTDRSYARKVTLKAGTLWAKVRKAEDEENLQFHTQGGVIGVKGTEFVATVSGDTTTVDVLEGTVDYTRGDKTTALPEGTTLEAKASGEPKTTKMDPAELRKIKEKQLEDLSRAVSIAGSILAVPGLGYASEFISLVKDPETYLKNRAISEVQSRVPVPIPLGGLFGGGKKEEPPPPPEPAGLQPSGGAPLTTYFPTFTWTCLHKHPQQYRIMVSRSDTLQSVTSGSTSQLDIAWEATTTGTSITYPKEARPLRPGLTYYWIIVPEQIKDGKPQPAGKVSQQAQFTLEEEKNMGKMVRASPFGSFVPKGDDLVFDWTEPFGAVQYRIRISEQKDLSASLVDQKVPFNYYILEKWETRGEPKLLKGKTYYWQAEALDEAGNVTGNTGDPFSFSLK